MLCEEAKAWGGRGTRLRGQRRRTSYLGPHRRPWRAARVGSDRCRLRRHAMPCELLVKRDLLALTAQLGPPRPPRSHARRAGRAPPTRPRGPCPPTCAARRARRPFLAVPADGPNCPPPPVEYSGGSRGPGRVRCAVLAGRAGPEGHGRAPKGARPARGGASMEGVARHGGLPKGSRAVRRCVRHTSQCTFSVRSSAG